MYRYISQRGQLIRSFTSGIGKTGIIIPAAFSVAIGLGLVGLGLIFYVREVFQALPRSIGLLAGMWAPPYVVGCLLLRPAFGRVRPRYLVVGSTTGMFLCVFAMQVVPRFEWLYLLAALYGLSISLFWPPLMGWLSSDIEGRQLGRVVNRFNMAWCTGSLVSPYLCGWLSQLDPRLPLVVASYIFLATASFVLGASRLLPRIRADRHVEDDGETERGGGNPHETFLRFPAWVGLFACFLAFGTLNAVLPVHAHDKLGFSKSAIGGLFFLRGLLHTLGFFLLGRTAFWHFRVAPMFAALWLAALILIGFSVSTSLLPLGLLMGGFGLTAAMAYSASIFHGASGSRNRARRMAIHESVLASGVMVGAAGGGAVYQQFSIAHVYALCALVLGGAAVVQWVLVRRRKPVRHTAPDGPA